MLNLIWAIYRALTSIRRDILPILKASFAASNELIEMVDSMAQEKEANTINAIE